MASMTSSRETLPIILTTGATPIASGIVAGVGGAPASIATSDLINTTRSPIEITELHFAMHQSSANVYGVGATEIRLRIGRYDITQGFCPVTALGPRREQVAVEGTTAAFAFAGDTVRWVLPRPLIVAPNEGFHGLVRLNGTAAPATTDTVQFSMTARGRRLPNDTKLTARAIPYASGAFMAAGVLAPEATFRNPFLNTLHVQSINIRPVPDTTGLSGNITISGPGGLANSVVRQITNGVSENVVFAQRHALEGPYDLNQNDRFQISVSAIDNQLAIVLTGWREES